MKSKLCRSQAPLLFFFAGCCLLHLLLCHFATEPGGNYSGEESVWPAKLSLPSECSATTNPREEMVGVSAKKKKNQTV